MKHKTTCSTNEQITTNRVWKKQKEIHVRKTNTETERYVVTEMCITKKKHFGRHKIIPHSIHTRRKGGTALVNYSITPGSLDTSLDLGQKGKVISTVTVKGTDKEYLPSFIYVHSFKDGGSVLQVLF